MRLRGGVLVLALGFAAAAGDGRADPAKAAASECRAGPGAALAELRVLAYPVGGPALAADAPPLLAPEREVRRGSRVVQTFTLDPRDRNVVECVYAGGKVVKLETAGRRVCTAELRQGRRLASLQRVSCR